MSGDDCVDEDEDESRDECEYTEPGDPTKNRESSEAEEAMESSVDDVDSEPEDEDVSESSVDTLDNDDVDGYEAKLNDVSSDAQRSLKWTFGSRKGDKMWTFGTISCKKGASVETGVAEEASSLSLTASWVLFSGSESAGAGAGAGVGSGSASG